MPEQVQDKKAEIGINLSVMAQSLILAGIVFFGRGITSGLDNVSENLVKLTAEVAELNTSIKLNTSEIANNKEHILENASRIKNLEAHLQEHIRHP